MLSPLSEFCKISRAYPGYDIYDNNDNNQYKGSGISMIPDVWVIGVCLKKN